MRERNLWNGLLFSESKQLSTEDQTRTSHAAHLALIPTQADVLNRKLQE